MLTIWGFEAAFFVVADGVAEVVHHNPREEAGFGVLGDEVIFGTGAPENASVNAEHGDDAVVFFFAWVFIVGEDGGFSRDETVWHKFLDFGRIGDFVKEESAVWFDNERHLTGLFGGGFDDFALETDGEFFKFGLKIVGFADHHRVDEFFNAFRIR